MPQNETCLLILVFVQAGNGYCHRVSVSQAPEPPPSWDGVFEATHRLRCPQDGSGDENCLVLNLFMPENETRLPVLVFVHDGHFQNG